MRWSGAVGRSIVLVVAASAGCRDSAIRAPTGSTGEPVATTIERIAVGDLAGIAGLALPVAPAVRVLDQNGDPLGGAQVRFTVEEGGGATLDTLLATDAAGIASTTWFLGPRAGVQRLRAAIPGTQTDGGALDLLSQAEAVSYDDAYRGRNGYVEYDPGPLPIIISAPHGGRLRPEEIPDRTFGVTVMDLNTEEVARLLADEIEETTGLRPTVVLCLLHRSKLDANRELEEAAQADAEAERAWFEYHWYISAARERVRDDHGAGLYIDLHGHGHAAQRVEVGYLLTSSDLALSNATLDGPAYARKSSIRAVAESDPAQPFSSLVRGPRSFGALLAAAGFPAIPAPDDPHPDGAPYFNGGYSTVRHGSREGGTISGFQLELNYTGVRDDEENRRAFAAAAADAVLTYVEERLGLGIPALQP